MSRAAAGSYSAAQPPTILHADLDSFYASVEQRDDPALRRKPVIVGGGVVLAASYEAKANGVRTAMGGRQARALCPHAIVVPPRMSAYSEASDRVFEVFHDTTPVVEPLSVDEAFLDVAGATRLFGDPPTIARLIRTRVLDDEGLTCSVGVAPNKFLAKLASEAAKPTATPAGPRPGAGVVVVPPGGELAFLHPLPVRALWGVGPKTQQILDRLGIRTVGDLADFDERELVTALGDANGRHLHRLAHAVDDRPVEPDLRPKSISHEETFARDHTTLATLRVEAVRMAEAVAQRLRRHGYAGRTVTIKVRFHDFRTITRSLTLPAAVDGGTEVARAAKGLLEQIDPAAGVRLLGVGVTNLDEHGAVQLRLDDAEAAGWHEATSAVDAIRDRFGDDAIKPGTLAGRPVKRPGDTQWGPAETP